MKKIENLEKIQRQVIYLSVKAFVAGLKDGTNNKWYHNRAPSGYLFQLVELTFNVAIGSGERDGIIAIYDGKKFHTRYTQFPGVEDDEILGRGITNLYSLSGAIDLHGWECKEYTIGIRSTSTVDAFKGESIVWYYLKKMTPFERYHSAIKQPKRKWKRGSKTTVELTEAET